MYNIINAVYFEMNCLSVMDISRVMLALLVSVNNMNINNDLIARSETLLSSVIK